MGGEDDHLGPRPDLEHLLGRLDPVALGQLDVDDQDVGLELLDHVDHIAAVPGLADDLDDARVGHPGLDRLADDLMVVAEDDALGVPNASAHEPPILAGEPYECKIVGSVNPPSRSCRFSIRAIIVRPTATAVPS